MRTLPGVALLLLCCAHQGHRHIFVPNTPEAKACWQRCKASEAVCLGDEPSRQAANYARTSIDMETRDYACDDERKDCLKQCPGTEEQWKAD